MIFMFHLQDTSAIGQPIYRASETDTQAIRLAKKDYPLVDFVVLDSYPLICEACE